MHPLPVYQSINCRFYSSSHGSSLPCPVYLFLHVVKFELKFFLALADLHALSTHCDWKSLIFTLEILLVPHELSHTHIRHLLHLWLFQVSILSCIRGHIRVHTALERRVVLLRLLLASACVAVRNRAKRFLGLPAERRMVQIIIGVLLLHTSIFLILDCFAATTTHRRPSHRRLIIADAACTLS